MKSTSILMNRFSMKGIRNKTKKNTRRVEKNQPEPSWKYVSMGGAIGPSGDKFGVIFAKENGEPVFIPSPYGGPGDELRFKESYCLHKRYDDLSPVKCAAIKRAVDDLDGDVTYMVDIDEKEDWMGRTRPSMFMPNEFIRERRILTEVRFERLRDISCQDAIDEGLEVVNECMGMPMYDCGKLPVSGGYGAASDPTEAYSYVWDRINADPKPVKINGKLHHYVSCPWKYFGDPIREHKGKKWIVYDNCWVWVLRWENE